MDLMSAILICVRGKTSAYKMRKGSFRCLFLIAPKVQAAAGFVSVFLLYFWRNFSTRPAVSMIFCLPV